MLLKFTARSALLARDLFVKTEGRDHRALLPLFSHLFLHCLKQGSDWLLKADSKGTNRPYRPWTGRPSPEHDRRTAAVLDG